MEVCLVEAWTWGGEEGRGREGCWREWQGCSARVCASMTLAWNEAANKAANACSVCGLAPRCCFKLFLVLWHPYDTHRSLCSAPTMATPVFMTVA